MTKRKKVSLADLGQKTAKGSHHFPSANICAPAHSFRPLVRTNTTVPTILEIMFRTLYNVVELGEYCEFTPHLGDDYIPEFLPLAATRDSTGVQDGWRFIIAMGE